MADGPMLFHSKGLIDPGFWDQLKIKDQSPEVLIWLYEQKLTKVTLEDIAQSITRSCPEKDIDWVLQRPNYRELLPDTPKLTAAIITNEAWRLYKRLKALGYELPLHNRGIVRGPPH